MHNTLDDFFEHIKQIHLKRSDFSLDRVHAVADRMQIKKFNCPVITIAGTNGKGSVAKTLESIYFHAGFTTALYTSPHLIEFNERIRIDNHNISDDDLLRALQQVESARENTILSFFEFITLSALFLFQQANVDVVILEAGLGGRLDAVNILDTDVAVLTSVGLDHTHLLGDSREAIAFEKASIVRANKPFICGDDNPPSNIADLVREKQAVLLQINRDFFCDDHELLSLSTLKPHNIAIALEVVRVLQNQLSVLRDDIKKGIGATKWPGRFECDESVFPCILDVAHNPPAAEWLAWQYKQLPRVEKTVAIVGMLKDKLIIDSVKPLLPIVDAWYVCDLRSESTERGSDGIVITEFLQSNKKKYDLFASVDDAMYSLAQSHCKQGCDRALIFGSFYLVAAAKRWLMKTQGERAWKKKANKG